MVGKDLINAKGGEVPEWPKGTGCKLVGTAFGGSNPPLSTSLIVEQMLRAGIAQLARAEAFQASCRGFESRFPLHNLSGSGEGAHVAQLAEHVLGKDGVTSSNLVVGSRNTMESMAADVTLL